MKSFPFSQFTSLSPTKCLDFCQTSEDAGLPSQEGRDRLRQHGPNTLNQTHSTKAQIFFRQWRSPFILMLAAAAILAYLLHEYTDAILIALFISINTLLGFFQEYRSEQALQLLKKYISSKVTVLRDGKKVSLDATSLVVGDVVFINPGDIISADVRLLKDQSLTIDESVLTGESVPVAKSSLSLKKPTKQIYQAENIAFSGTTVVSGSAMGVVFATGSHTYLGGIATKAHETERISSFEKNMGKFSQFILKLVLITLVIIFAVNWAIKGSETNVIELVIFSIALATAAIPEALPLVITFSLSRGALRLAKNKVVVKRLSAIEDLGGIQVLCTDKTGTITQNKLTVSDTYGSKPPLILFYASLAGGIDDPAHPSDPFDQAINTALTKQQQAQWRQVSRLDSLPFDPQRRRNSVLISQAKRTSMIVRGAPEAIIPFCANLTQKEKNNLTQWQKEQGKLGRRVLVVAYRSDFNPSKYSLKTETQSLSFLGLIALHDPLKPTTIPAFAKAKQLGVQIKILTGDDPVVSAAVAHQVGLAKSDADVITGEAFDQLSTRKQHEAVEKYHVFSRVSPEQKFHIIKLLEESYQVGFLGEGINDAPALKAANVALAVQSASDVSRESADIILLKKSLQVIIDGIEEGRCVFANTIKYTKLTLSSNFGNFYAVAIASLITDFLPMLPIQILLVNLLSDFPLIAVATDTVDQQDLLQPETYNLKDLMFSATLFGIVSTVFDFLFFGIFYRISAPALQTNWYIGSILTELALVFSLRTRLPFLKANKPSAVILILSLLAAITTLALPYTEIGQNLFRFSPPTLAMLVLDVTLVILYISTTETVKLLYQKHLASTANGQV